MIDLEKAAQQEITSLRKQLEEAKERLNNPQGLVEMVCLEQLEGIPLLEIHRAHQELHEENVRLSHRVYELENSIVANKFALENQIKALEWLNENNLMEDETTTLLLERIEQLRKEHKEIGGEA